MTITMYGISSPVTDAVNNLDFIDGSNWAVIDTTFDTESGARESLFQKLDETAAYPTTVRIGFYPKEETDGTKTYNVSVRMNAYVSDDASGSTVYKPYTAVLAWTMPFAAVPSAANMMSLVGQLSSWIVADVATGALASTFLAKLAYGITELDLANISHT